MIAQISFFYDLPVIPSYLDGAFFSALPIDSCKHDTVASTPYEAYNVEITTQSVDLFAVHIVAASLKFQ